MNNHLCTSNRPIYFLGSLAKSIGLNETIFLQELHYRVQSERYEQDEELWTICSMKEWHNRLPFWSERIIERAVKNLKGSGIVVSVKIKGFYMNPTKIYRIDYKILTEKGVILC